MLFACLLYFFCSTPSSLLYFPFTSHNLHKPAITKPNRKRHARIKLSEGPYVLLSVARGGLRQPGT